MKITILGAGFIGKNLIARAVEDGCELTVMTRNPTNKIVHPNLKWLKGEFLNEQDLKDSLEDANVVVHLISNTVPGDDVDENKEIFTNVSQTINLLKICIKNNIKKVIFISSSSVYGVQDSVPICEDASTNPISTHGIHKLTIEKYIQYYNYVYNMNCKIIRLSNPYGKWQPLNGRQGFIGILIGNILNGKETFLRSENEIVRDFIYIDDVIDAIMLIINTESRETIFNIGSGVGTTLHDVITVIEKLTKKKIQVKKLDSRQTDIPRSVLDISRAKKELGFYPKPLYMRV